jgi:hypothetical protein
LQLGIALPGNGPKQEVIGTEDTKDPSLPLYSSNVPKSKSSSCRSGCVINGYCQWSCYLSIWGKNYINPPDRTAPTNSKSLEVQELASGNVWLKV